MTAEDAKMTPVEQTKPVEEKAEEKKVEETKPEQKKAEETEPEGKKRSRSEEAKPPAPEPKRRKLGLDMENGGILFTSPSKFVMKKGEKDLMFMLGRCAKTSEGNEKKRKFELLYDQKLPAGCGFLQLQKDVVSETPSELTTALLEKVLAKTEKSQNLGRIMPFDKICKPQLEAFEQLAVEVIKPAFLNSEGKRHETPITWALQFKQRGMKTLDKMAVLKVIDQWSDGCKVSIDDPEVCICVDVNPVFCGVGLLKGWKKFEKYNVGALMNPEKSEQDREAMKQKQKSLEAKKEEEKKVEEKAEEKKTEEKPGDAKMADAEPEDVKMADATKPAEEAATKGA